MDIPAIFRVMAEHSLHREPLALQQWTFERAFDSTLPGTPQVLRNISSSVEMIQISDQMKALQAAGGKLLAFGRNLLVDIIIFPPYLRGQPLDNSVKSRRKFDEHLCVHLPSMASESRDDAEKSDQNRPELCKLNQDLSRHSNVPLDLLWRRSLAPPTATGRKSVGFRDDHGAIRAGSVETPPHS